MGLVDTGHSAQKADMDRTHQPYTSLPTPDPDHLLKRGFTRSRNEQNMREIVEIVVQSGLYTPPATENGKPPSGTKCPR